MDNFSLKAGATNWERGVWFRSAAGHHIFYSAKELAIWKIKNQPFFYKLTSFGKNPIKNPIVIKDD